MAHSSEWQVITTEGMYCWTNLPSKGRTATLSVMRSRAGAVNLFRDMRDALTCVFMAPLQTRDHQLFRFSSSRTRASVISPVGSCPTVF